MSLLLTRRVNEKIIIGDDISVCFIKKNGNQITFAVEAPRRILILREELYQRFHHKGQEIVCDDEYQQQTNKRFFHHDKCA